MGPGRNLVNVIRRMLPASKLGPHPSQSLSPFQLALGTWAFDAHKGAGELASSVPTLGQGSSANWAEKAGRALEPSPSSWERTGVWKGAKSWEELGKGFHQQELPGLLISPLTSQM